MIHIVYTCIYALLISCTPFFLIILQKKEILDHADKIKTLVKLKQWDEIEKHTKELSEILSIGKRMCIFFVCYFLLDI